MKRSLNFYLRAGLFVLIFCFPIIAFGDLPSTGESLHQQNLLKRAEAGDPEAQFQVGMNYVNNEGENRDMPKGIQWIRRAASNGHPMGQTRLGFAYFSSNGVPGDDQTALFWFHQAVKKEHIFAPYFLGIMYDTGRGVEMNASAAFHFYLQSALNGHPYALGALATMYETGDGQPKDLAEAHALYELAAEMMKKQGNDEFILLRAGETKVLRKIALRRKASIAKDLSPEGLKIAHQRKIQWEQKLRKKE